MDNTTSKPPAGRDTRRTFIKKAATAAAAVAATGIIKTPVYGQSSAPSTGRVIGANDRIAVAIVGVGYGIGQDHIMGIQRDAQKNNTVMAAACDVYAQRRAWIMGNAEDTGQPGPTWSRDFNFWCTTFAESGCEHNPDNPFSLFVQVGGHYQACRGEDICNDLLVER